MYVDKTSHTHTNAEGARLKCVGGGGGGDSASFHVPSGVWPQVSNGRKVDFCLRRERIVDLWSSAREFIFPSIKFGVQVIVLSVHVYSRINNIAPQQIRRGTRVNKEVALAHSQCIQTTGAALLSGY